jgi:hypothetical protein
MTISEHILKYVREKNTWVNGGDIEKFIETLGHKGSTASRTLRTLSETESSPLIKEIRKGNKVASVWYRPKSPEKIIEYKVNGIVVSRKVVY